MGQSPFLIKKSSASAYSPLLFLLIFLSAAFLFSLWNWIDTPRFPIYGTTSTNQTNIVTISERHSTVFNTSIIPSPASSEEKVKPYKSNIEYPLNCSIGNPTQIGYRHYPETFTPEEQDDPSSRPTCPNYFRWIHEDLRRWKETGITREMVEKGKRTAHFRLVIVDGKAFAENYRKSIQTRDVFTMWGILQLLRRYPGRVPDLELMFDCDDLPVIRARHYSGFQLNDTGPPPLFRYCSNRWSEDIVFPDWSFWGWLYLNSH